MPEKETYELIPMQVVYVCDACKIGIMEYTGEIITGKGFEHKCDNEKCGATIALQYKYPIVKYKKKIK